MEAKEKAKELFDKMYSWQLASVKTYTPNVAMVIAKQSAIIAVEEIMNAIYDNGTSSNYYKYWQEVKIEIEKL